MDRFKLLLSKGYLLKALRGVLEVIGMGIDRDVVGVFVYKELVIWHLLLKGEFVRVVCVFHRVQLMTTPALPIHVLKLFLRIRLPICQRVISQLLLWLSVNIRRHNILLTGLFVSQVTATSLLTVIISISLIVILPSELCSLVLFWTWLILVRLVFVETDRHCTLVARLCFVHLFIYFLLLSFLFKFFYYTFDCLSIYCILFVYLLAIAL